MRRSHRSVSIATMEFQAGVLSALAYDVSMALLRHRYEYLFAMVTYMTSLIQEYDELCMPWHAIFSMILQTEVFQQKFQIFSKKKKLYSNYLIPYYNHFFFYLIVTAGAIEQM